METNKNEQQSPLKESVFRKIQKALARAENNANENEARTSMLLAQKLMAKHNISMGEVSDSDFAHKKEVFESKVHVGRKLQWWEKELSNIIAHNFRCFTYWNTHQQTFKFLGLKEDAEICKEVFEFARSAMKHFTEKFMFRVSGSRAQLIKKNYMLGFLEGLSEAFREQVARDSLQLVLVIDEEVEIAKKEKKIKAENVYTPNVSMVNLIAHVSGYEDGKELDYRFKKLEEGTTNDPL